MERSDARKRHEQKVTVEWRDGPSIVGLSGYAQSGKDSTGKVLVERYGYTRHGFADALRDVLYALNPIIRLNDSDTLRYARGTAALQPYVDACGWEWVKANTNAREYLQRLGTEAGRDILGDDLWVRTLLAKLQPGGKYVITDVRFPNEFDAIKSAGGQVWRLKRQGTDATNAHVSETALDHHLFDWHLTLPDFGGDLDALNGALVEQVGAVLFR